VGAGITLVKHAAGILAETMLPLTLAKATFTAADHSLNTLRDFGVNVALEDPRFHSEVGLSQDAMLSSVRTLKLDRSPMRFSC
jgi:hypothetical protein